MGERASGDRPDALVRAVDRAAHRTSVDTHGKLFVLYAPTYRWRQLRPTCIEPRTWILSLTLIVVCVQASFTQYVRIGLLLRHIPHNLLRRIGYQCVYTLRLVRPRTCRHRNTETTVKLCKRVPRSCHAYCATIWTGSGSHKGRQLRSPEGSRILSTSNVYITDVVANMAEGS